MKAVNRILWGQDDYVGREGELLSAADTVSATIEGLKDRLQQPSVAKQWIRDYWQEKYGTILPGRFKNWFQLSEMIYRLSEKKGVDPVVVITHLNNPCWRGGMFVRFAALERTLARQIGDTTFDQWMRRVT